MENLRYIVQGRITVTLEQQHACVHCGARARLLDLSYEPASEEHQKQLKEELQHAANWRDALRLVQNGKIKADDAVFEATVNEQRSGPIQEHDARYICMVCEADIIDRMTNIPGGGYTILRILWEDPERNALFILREIADPLTPALVFKTDYQDVTRAQEHAHSSEFQQLPTFKKE